MTHLYRTFTHFHDLVEQIQLYKFSSNFISGKCEQDEGQVFLEVGHHILSSSLDQVVNGGVSGLPTFSCPSR